jgi:DNA/RNA endonuclease G (NUC1)
MHARIIAALLCGCAAASTAVADTVVVNDQVQVRESQTPTPHSGSTMSDVEKQFGAPASRHPTVGEPPITRWDYNGFAVFFERDRVIHAVVTGG